MPEITPTPRAGHWLRLSPVPVEDPQPRAGHWLRLSPVPRRTTRRGFGLIR